MDFENPNIKDLIHKILTTLKQPHVLNEKKIFQLMCGINIYSNNNFSQLVDLYYGSPLSKYNNLNPSRIRFIKSQIQYEITQEPEHIIDTNARLNKLSKWVTHYMKIYYRKRGQLGSLKPILQKINANLGYILYRILPEQ